jgi:uncharacterized delta-60 repeat protein
MVKPSSVCYRGEGPYPALSRFNTDGSLDSTFGHGGIAAGVGAADSISALAIQADGKIVAAESSIIERYNIDGSRDSGFGTAFGLAGIVNTNITMDIPYFAKTLSIQADGKIVAAGVSGYSFCDASPLYFALVRYNTDGSPDSSFGTNGIVTGFSEDTYATALAIQADGKLIAAMYSYSKAPALVRFNTDGTQDLSFGTDGFMITTVNSANNGEVLALIIQADGKLVAAEGSYNGTDTDFAIARYLP